MSIVLSCLLEWVVSELYLKYGKMIRQMSSVDQSNPHSNSSNVNSILSLCSKVTLDGTNYNDWIGNIKMALRFENKEYVIDTELVEIDPDTATPEEIASYQKHTDDATKVACIMIATMKPELQRIYENYWPYEMHKDLAEKFCKQARVERCEVVKAFMNDKPKDGESVCTHVSSSNGPRAKSSGILHVTNPKDADCFYCKEKGHWKRSCPKYLQDIKDGKVKPSQAGPRGN